MRSATMLYSGTILTVLASAAAAPASTIADLNADWTTSANPNSRPNGAWAYMQSAIPLSYIAAWAGDPNQTGWGPPANVSGNFLPFMFKTPVEYGDALPDDVIVHTTDGFNGSGNGDAIILWTSAVSGTMDISGSLWPTRLIGRLNEYQLVLRHAGTPTVLATGAVPEDGSVSRANPTTFQVWNQPIVIGDRLELTIVRATAPGDFAGVNLTVATSCIGDLNHDHVRDLGDLSLLLSQYGCSSGCTADVDGDGDVDLADLATELSVYGVPCP